VGFLDRKFVSNAGHCPLIPSFPATFQLQSE
jgi:hypothetical protein